MRLTRRARHRNLPVDGLERVERGVVPAATRAQDCGAYNAFVAAPGERFTRRPPPGRATVVDMAAASPLRALRVAAIGRARMRIYFGSAPSTPSTYQLIRCRSASPSVLPAGTFTAPD